MPAVSVRRAKITTQEFLAKLERQLTGRNDPAGGPYSDAAFERMCQASYGNPAGEQDLREFAEGWVRHGPAAVFAWLEDHQAQPPVGGIDFSGYNFKAYTLCKAWAKVDLEAALAAASRLTVSASRTQALMTSLQVLWKTAPDRARSMIERNLDLFAGKEWIYLPGDGATSAEKDLAFLRSLPAGKTRGKLLSTMFETMITHPGIVDPAAVSFWKTAPDDVRREIIAAGSLDRRESYPAYYSAEAVKSLPGAEDLLRTHALSTGNPRDAQAFISQHGREWAARDLPAALAWTREHIGGKASMEHSINLFQSAAASDFDTAVREWHTLPSGLYKAKAAKALLDGASDRHKPAATALFESLPARQRSAAH
jgi:hypothetical protein